MSKANRRQKVKELLSLEWVHDDIIETVTTEFNVTAKTVKADIESLGDVPPVGSETIEVEGGVKENEVYVIAEIEQRLFDHQTGEKLSSPVPNQSFTAEDWKQFQEHGPGQGWFVNEVKEAPEGIDLTYNNPGKK